jgi:hypothetical protein
MNHGIGEVRGWRYIEGTTRGSYDQRSLSDHRDTIVVICLHVFLQT